MPDPYTPCGRATPQTALRPFGGGPAPGRAACGRFLPPWIPLPVRAWKKGSELRKLGRLGREEENSKFSKNFQKLQFKFSERYNSNGNFLHRRILMIIWLLLVSVAKKTMEVVQDLLPFFISS
jgi:hypothetical protein